MREDRVLEKLWLTSSVGSTLVQVYRSRSKHSSFMMGGMSWPLKIQKPLQDEVEHGSGQIPGHLYHA